MLLICPKCATSYQVDLAALGAAGRSVRCSRCQTLWFAAPAVPAPELVSAGAAADAENDPAVAAFRTELASDAAAPAARSLAEDPQDDQPATGAAAEADAGSIVPELGQPAASGEPSLDDLMDAQAEHPAAEPPADAAEEPSSDALPVADAPPLAPVESDAAPGFVSTPEPDKDIEAFARRRAARSARKRKGSSRWPLMIVGLTAVLAALLIWRGKVVQHAPQMASLYAAIGLPVNLRGLSFVEVTTTKDSHDGVPVLVVEGKIVNTASIPVEVPRLRFAVQSASGAEIYAWTAQPPKAVLTAGETLPFRSRLASPPAEGQSVLVRFFTRRDAAGGPR